jgi:hypothetical protein
MNRSRLARAALAGLLLLGRAARADQPPSNQIDIDALEKQYKNMPGGDLIVQKLEAQRAQIEAANKKNAAASKAAPAPSGPVKGPAEMLALIPEPPRTVAEARSRTGKIVDAQGKLGSDDGDAKSNPAMAAIASALMQSMLHPYSPSAAPRALGPGQGEALKFLNEESGRIGKESRALYSETMKSQADFKSALDAQVQGVEADFGPKLDKACPDGEGLKLSDFVNCKPTWAARTAKLRAAREAYLAKIAPPLAAARAKAKELIAAASAMHARARAAFGDEASLPGGAGMLLVSADGSLRQILAGFVEANNQATKAAAAKDYEGPK